MDVLYPLSSNQQYSYESSLSKIQFLYGVPLCKNCQKCPLSCRIMSHNLLHNLLGLCFPVIILLRSLLRSWRPKIPFGFLWFPTQIYSWFPQLNIYLCISAFPYVVTAENALPWTTLPFTWPVLFYSFRPGWNEAFHFIFLCTRSIWYWYITICLILF